MTKQSPTGSELYMGTAKLGPKGQIVIPKEVRAMFSLQPGDTLILLADSNRGLVVDRADKYAAITDAIFSGSAKSLYPEQSESEAEVFADAIQNTLEGGEEHD